MAQNVTIAGSTYPDVPAVMLSVAGGGAAMFLDSDEFMPLAGGTFAGAVTHGHDLVLKEATAADDTGSWCESETVLASLAPTAGRLMLVKV